MNIMCSGSLCLELEKIILQDDETLPEDTVQSQNIPHDYSEVLRKM